MEKTVTNAPSVLRAKKVEDLTTKEIALLTKIFKIEPEKIPDYYRADDCFIVEFTTLSVLKRELNHAWSQRQDISFLCSVPDFLNFMCRIPHYIEDLVKFKISSISGEYGTHVNNVEFLVDNFLNQLSCQNKEIKEKMQHAHIFSLCEYLIEVYYRCERISDKSLMTRSSLLFGRLLASARDYVSTLVLPEGTDKETYLASKLLVSLEKACVYDKYRLNPDNELISQLWGAIEPHITNLWAHHPVVICHTLLEKITPNHPSYWVVEELVNKNPLLAFNSMTSQLYIHKGLLSNLYHLFKEKIKDLNSPEKEKIILACFKYFEPSQLVDLSTNPAIPALDIYNAFSAKKDYRNEDAYEKLWPYKVALRARLDKEELSQALPLPSQSLPPTNKI